MFRLKHLEIARFRTVAPGTRLDFADGFNVLLGKNGAGKTSLLRLLEAITTSSFAAFKDEALDLTYVFAGTGGEIRVHVENVHRERSTSVDPTLRLLEGAQGDAEYADKLRVELSLRVGADSLDAVVETTEGQTTWALQGEKAEPSKRPVLPTQGMFLLSAMALLIADRRPKFARHLMSIARLAVSRFDESLGYYSEIKTRSFDAIYSPADHTSGFRFMPYGTLWLSDDAKVPRGGTSVSFGASEVPFLQTFIDAMGGIKDAELQLNMRFKDADRATTYGGLRVWLTRLDGSGYSDDTLSYGQKRLFSFLYYLAATESTVVADELVNGLHHAWIDICVKQIGDRQAFLSSQNPLLMDHLAFDSAEDVRRAFVLCQLAYEGDAEVLQWRNMTLEEARGVFEAGEVGIEHMSTILRNEGLW